MSIFLQPLLRSPKASSAPVEPAYYKEWGPSIFRLGALEDKLELKEAASPRGW